MEMNVMAKIELNESTLKKLFKEALTETFQEQRELLHQLFAEAMEDVALEEAIREGRQTETVPRKAIFRTLECSFRHVSPLGIFTP